ncbi:hypothetical protein Zmor_025332 [Zophobas morio]|uniref:Uncharacterized protein n=1 Tax=Zophobas morio TaxID=2755281 RepID=A0AA38HTU4_9CUCU|nr:hypothetical protein Zmor_025332 [Zophobas morio]
MGVWRMNGVHRVQPCLTHTLRADIDPEHAVLACLRHAENSAEKPRQTYCIKTTAGIVGELNYLPPFSPGTHTLSCIVMCLLGLRACART